MPISFLSPWNNFLPSGGGAPGTAPSGTPAIPKTSTSMDSLPGLAKGTLHTLDPWTPCFSSLKEAIFSPKCSPLQDGANLWTLSLVLQREPCTCQFYIHQGHRGQMPVLLRITEPQLDADYGCPYAPCSACMQLSMIGA